MGRCTLTPGTPWFLQLTPRLLSGTFRDFRGLSGTFRDFQRVKLEHDKLLLNIGFNCNLRRYTAADELDLLGGAVQVDLALNLD